MHTTLVVEAYLAYPNPYLYRYTVDIDCGGTIHGVVCSKKTVDGWTQPINCSYDGLEKTVKQEISKEFAKWKSSK